MEGYQKLLDDQIITIWSAPNYCYRFNNIGCIMRLDQNQKILFQTIS